MARKKHAVASIGCGIIGQAWTILFTSKGHDTKLYHSKKERLSEAIKRIEKTLTFLDKRGILVKSSVKESLSRIYPVTSLTEALSEAEFVQESLPEKEDLKMEMFREMDRLSSPQVILSSSTSSLSMSKIQRAARRPERCITSHPFNPPYLVPLVEIVPGVLTSKRTVERTFDFLESLGRVPIVLRKEARGFVGNRLAGALWREAIDLVVKGVVSAEEVDKAVYAGLGLRWAIMGQHLIYTINGGEGGMPAFIERYGPGYSRIWDSLDSWTQLSPQRKRKFVKSVEAMPILAKNSYEELVRQRDEKLISILRALHDYKL